MKIGICHLYKREDELCQSHIFPKFMYESLKWSNKSKFLTDGQKCAPMQDGYKVPLLCKQAELQFSNYEKWFKRNVYEPYHFKKAHCHVEYDDTLYKFLVMQIWRTFEEIASNRPADQFELGLYKELRNALEEWRLYLADGIFPMTYNTFYLMPISCENIGIPMFLETELYIRRIFEANILMCDDGNKVPYCKMPSFYIWAPLIKTESTKFGYNISPDGGELTLDDFVVSDFEVIDYIHGKICDYAKRRNQEAKERPEYIKKLQRKMQTDKEFQDSELAEILQKPQIPYLYRDDTTTILWSKIELEGKYDQPLFPCRIC